MSMSSTNAVPLLIGILVAALLGLIAWGFWKHRRRQDGDGLMDTYDRILTGLLILFILALGVFVSYTFQSLNF